MATASDNCTGKPIITYKDGNFSSTCPGSYSFERVWTVSDSCGNTAATVTQNISVEDTTKPAFTFVPNDTTLYKDASCNADTTTAGTGMATASDNCTGKPIITYKDGNFSSTCPGSYSFERVWTVSDSCGNTAATVTQNISVEDTTKPAFTFVPNDTTLYKDASCNADTTTAGTGMATASDNCTGKPIITYADGNFGSTCQGSYSFDRVWTVSDSCGNTASAKTQHITVLDTVKPTFTVPANDTLCREHPSQAISAAPSVTGEPTGQSDNCTDAATLVAHTSFADLDTTGTDDDLRVIEREWTVTDACGNSTVKMQYIAIRPAINSGNTTITCPPAVDMTMWYGACDTLLNIGLATFTTAVTDPAVADHLHVTATYNGEVIATDAAGEWRFPEGDNVVTWTVTDTCGFSLSCEQHVVVHFPPCGPGHEVDYDGHTYQTVRVGCECWLKENLRNTKYADGTDVPSYSSYEHSAQNEADFGMLYSWYSAMKVAEWDNNTQPSTQAGPNGLDYIQGICPDGWAVPTDAQYDDLWLNGYGTEGIKDMDGRYWLPGLAGTTPNCGFNARGAGYYDGSVDRYYNLLGETYFWTGDPVTTVEEGHCSVITMTCPQMMHTVYPKGHGHSVRCVQKR